MKPAAKTGKISQRLEKKCADPFASSKTKFKTMFAREHSSGAVPVHISHTGNKMTLVWDVPHDGVNEERMLLLSAEGLRETSHPYAFLAPQTFESLMQRDGIGQRSVVPVLDKLVLHLRAALVEAEVFSRGLSALLLISDAAGPALNKYLPQILQNLAKHLHSREHRESVEDALVRIETNGGPEASKAIKAKVPTYSTMYKVDAAKPQAKRAAFS